MNITIYSAIYSDTRELLDIFENARGEMKYLPVLHTKDQIREFIKNIK